jgi:Ca2+-binding EF-hand superfamily protein
MSSKKKVDHAKHVISVYRNKDPSMVLSEVGGLRVVPEGLEYVGAELDAGTGQPQVYKEWKWETIKTYATKAGEADGEFDTFTMEVEGEGEYEFEAEVCDHLEGAFNFKIWDPKTYEIHATKQQKAICKSAFDVMDIDNGGTIESKEMKRMLKLLGKKFTKKCKTLNALVETANKTPVDFDVFLAALEKDQNALKTTDTDCATRWRFLTHSTLHKMREVADVRKAFDTIDADGSGELDLDEMGKCLRKLGHKVKKKKLNELMDTLGEPGTGVLTWLQFVDSVADGTLDELQFAKGVLEVENLILIGDEGAHFIFTFRDPTQSLPEEVLMKINAADIDLLNANDRETATSWGWADVEDYWEEEEDDPDPEDMALFHIIYDGREFIFECDDGIAISCALKKVSPSERQKHVLNLLFLQYQDEFIQKKKIVAKAMSMVTEREKTRIKSVFQCIDSDGSGEISLKECIVMLRVLGNEVKSATAISGRMDKAGDGYISFPDFLEVGPLFPNDGCSVTYETVFVPECD